MDGIEIFKKLRDVCDDVVKALESKDEEAVETALAKFMLFMAKLDAFR